MVVKVHVKVLALGLAQLHVRDLHILLVVVLALVLVTQHAPVRVLLHALAHVQVVLEVVEVVAPLHAPVLARAVALVGVQVAVPVDVLGVQEVAPLRVQALVQVHLRDNVVDVAQLVFRVALRDVQTPVEQDVTQHVRAAA